MILQMYTDVFEKFAVDTSRAANLVIVSSIIDCYDINDMDMFEKDALIIHRIPDHEIIIL